MSSNEKLVRLGDYCSKIGSGSTPRGGASVYLKEGPFTLIRSQNVHNDGFKYDGLVCIDDDAAAKLKNVAIESGDILLNITGDSVARVCLVKDDVLPARVNQHVAIIRPKKNEFDARYLKYFLVDRQQQAFLHVLSSVGATRNALTKLMIENLEVPKLDLKIQSKIADILSSLDDKIENNRRMNETLEGMAQAIFKSWFVDFEPTRAKMAGESEESIITRLKIPKKNLSLFPNKLVESELGLIPEGWEVKKIGDVIQRLKVPIRFTKREVESYGITPVYEQGADILLGFHNGKAAFKASSEKPLFIFGDHTCITHLSCEPFDISQNTIPISGKNFSTIWTYYAVHKKQTFQEYRRHWSEFVIKEICIPSITLTEDFAKTIKNLILQKELNSRENRTLSQIRDTIIPKLLSGEISVSRIQICIEDQ